MKKLFVLALGLVLFSCDSDDGGSGPSAPTPSAEYYIGSSMDGEYVLYQEGDDFEVALSENSSLSSEGCTFSYGASISKNTSNSYPWYVIKFNNWIETSAGEACSDDDIWAPSLTQGPVSFSMDDTRGIQVRFTTEDGQAYSSSVGLQDNSAFELTSVEIIEPTMFTIESAKIKGTFSCKLYNEANPSDVRNVTDGTFSLPLSSSQH